MEYIQLRRFSIMFSVLCILSVALWFIFFVLEHTLSGDAPISTATLKMMRGYFFDLATLFFVLTLICGVVYRVKTKH